MKYEEFDREIHTCVNNNTWNENDYIGVLLICLLLAPLFFRTKKFFLICYVLLALILITNPVSILYPVSCLISLHTRTPEFLDKDEYFPNNYMFERNYDTISNELTNFMRITNNGHSLIKTAETFGEANAYIGSDVKGEDNAWRLFQIKILGKVMPEAKENFPTVVNILEKCPEVLSCVVSVLEPRVKIPAHVGYSKAVVRYMLPLKIPRDKENCFLVVNHHRYVWTEGIALVWDDTYPHMVMNNTDETRVVLYMDIERTGLNKFEKFLGYCTQAIVKASPVIQTQMSAQEKRMKL